MDLSRHGREDYTLEITTDPVTAPTDWEASFDGGRTWHTAVEDDDGFSAWLVAGRQAPDTVGDPGVELGTDSEPVVRLIDDPEVIIRDAPFITIT